jgi:hypothetical protein
MPENILLKNILSIEDFFTLPGRLEELEKNSLQAQQVNLTYNCDVFTGANNDLIFGKSTSSADSSAVAESILDHTLVADSRTAADANALALGLVNSGRIFTGKGNDTILGVADASGSAIADSQSVLTLEQVRCTKALSNSMATVNVLVDAVGISNSGQISTFTGDDVIVGLANATAWGQAKTNSQTELVLSSNSTATANSESIVIVETLAIGMDNSGKINTGEGRDLIIGLANASAMSEAEAAALAFNTTILTPGNDAQVLQSVGKAIANSKATAVSTTTTLGIVNSGHIYTDSGNDVIAGIAINQSSSKALATSVAESVASAVAKATANAQALAIAEGSAVGLVNLGSINTAEGDDIVIGIAIDSTAAIAQADANAFSFTRDTNAQATTNTLADTSQAITIGIDNTGGTILTAKGNDQVIGIGEVGVLGGNFNTGKGEDRFLSYGSVIGVQDSEVRLGQGNDFFQAAIANFDPITGGISFDLDQSGSIKNTQVFGDLGNDTFEIGDFQGQVLIDGGQDFDSLRLWGNLEDYHFTGSADHKTLTIEDGGSILTVQNIEAIYYGDSAQVYHVSNFA